jgi:hypothetical protein
MAISAENARALRKRLRGWDAELKEHGYFGAVALDPERACQDIVDNPKGREEFLPSARQVLKLIRLTKAEILKGNADEAARWAFDAGKAWRHAWFADVHGDDVRYAVKAEAARDRGRATKKRNQAAQMSKRRAIMARLTPKIGVQAAAKRCEAENLGDWRAVKRWWDRSGKEMRDIV